MLPFLAKLHFIAAERGEGLHPGLLAQGAEDTSTVIPSSVTELARPFSDGGVLPSIVQASSVGNDRQELLGAAR
jgi:hypothetical protein